MKKKFTFLFVLLCISILFVQNPRKVFYLFNDTLFSSNENQDSILLTNEVDNKKKLSNLNQSSDMQSFDTTKSNSNSQETESTQVHEVNTLPMSDKKLRSLPAGTILKTNNTDTIIKNCFYMEDINDDIKARIFEKSYKKNCTISYDSLKYIRVLYYGFDSETHIGELIVNKDISSDILDVFKELYQLKYPIESMILVDDYDADDNASMAANNTSAFNYRTIPGSSRLSNHSLGLAIDINPLYNPYVFKKNNKLMVLPTEGSLYADRSLNCPYYIKKEDACYLIFKKHGFTWGGSWKSRQDYQHFEKEIKK